MNWTLITILGGLAVLITMLMRPDIYLSVLRGGGERKKPKVFRAKSDKDFLESLNPGSPDNEKRDEHHG